MSIARRIEEVVKIVKKEETKNEGIFIENDGMVKKFFPYPGRFRLEGNLKATNNYFVPIYSGLLNVLFLLYKDRAENTSRYIKSFLEKMEIEILKEYSIEELNYSMECLNKIDTIQTSQTYYSLKQLLEASTKNKERINNLGLNDKFIDAIKVKQLDEEFNSIIAKVNEPFYKMYYNGDKKHN